jgi:hypothetical protein
MTHSVPPLPPTASAGSSDDPSLSGTILLPIGFFETDVLEFPDTSAGGDRKRRAIHAILEAARTAAEENWNGEGGLPVRGATVAQAIRFARLLPSTVSTPEVSADADGEISFDWDRDARRVFSVSVGPDGTLTYAGLFGHNRAHGTEFMAEPLPQSIRLNLRRVLTESLT